LEGELDDVVMQAAECKYFLQIYISTYQIP